MNTLFRLKTTGVSSFKRGCIIWCSYSVESTPKLAYEIIGNPDAPNTAVFLHGIIGSKRNWRTPSKKFVQAMPTFKSIIIDQRGHGSSHVHCDDNSVHQCADDLDELFHQLKIRPDIVCGHSFGGKVALSYLYKQIENNLVIPNNTWIIDSLPGPLEIKDVRSDQQSVKSVIEILENLPKVFPSRDAAIKLLEDNGLSKAIAQWLSTSLISINEDKEYTWSFNLPVIKELFLDFCKLDLWPSLYELDKADQIHHVHFLRAGRNPAWTPDVLASFDKLMKANPNIRLHHMPHVGHWVHVEDLQGLLSIITRETIVSP